MRTTRPIGVTKSGPENHKVPTQRFQLTTKDSGGALKKATRFSAAKPSKRTSKKEGNSWTDSLKRWISIVICSLILVLFFNLDEKYCDIGDLSQVSIKNVCFFILNDQCSKTLVTTYPWNRWLDKVKSLPKTINQKTQLSSDQTLVTFHEILVC